MICDRVLLLFDYHKFLFAIRRGRSNCIAASAGLVPEGNRAQLVAAPLADSATRIEK